MELEATDFWPRGIILKFHDSSQAMEERRLGKEENEKAISTWQPKLKTVDEGNTSWMESSTRFVSFNLFFFA